MATRNDALFGETNTSIYLSNVFCHGDETDLLLCSHDSIGQSRCDNSETAGVICGRMFALH